MAMHHQLDVGRWGVMEHWGLCDRHCGCCRAKHMRLAERCCRICLSECQLGRVFEMVDACLCTVASRRKEVGLFMALHWRLPKTVIRRILELLPDLYRRDFCSLVQNLMWRHRLLR